MRLFSRVTVAALLIGALTSPVAAQGKKLTVVCTANHQGSCGGSRR